MGFLASGNHFFFFFIFQALLAVKAFFGPVYKFIFITNTLFWLVETILFQLLKYPFYWKQFFRLMEIYLNPLLRPVARIFCLMGTIFFDSYFFWKQLLPLEGDHYFKKSYFC